MTRLLEMAVEAARQLSPEEQDDLARAIMEMVGGVSDEVYVLSDEERAAIDEGTRQAENDQFATDEQVAALFAKYRA